MNIQVIPVSLIASGMLLMALFDRTPRFQDSGWQRRVHDGDAKSFYLERDRSVTQASKLWHLGAGVAALGLVLGVGCALLEIGEMGELADAVTPRRKLTMFILANVIWLALIPVQDHWWQYTLQRGDYPWWSETTIVGMIGNTLMIVLGLPLINAGLAVCLSGSELPAKLWLPPKGFWPWLATAITAILFLMTLPTLLHVVVNGDFLAVPLWCVLLFLMLCARAGVTSGQDREAAPGLLLDPRPRSRL